MTPQSSQKGFSLIESLIALSILAITMLGVVQLFAVAIRQNSFSRYNTMAISVAQEKLEYLQTEYSRELENNVNAADLTVATHNQAVTLTQPTGSGTGDFAFDVNWTVTEIGSAKVVTVTVSPVVTNEFQTKDLVMTAVFSP